MSSKCFQLLIIFNLLLIAVSSTRQNLNMEPDADFYSMESDSFTSSQTTEAECSKCYRALVLNLLKNSTNFFNLQTAFFPANGTTPDFVIVTYYYNTKSNTSSPEVNKTVWFWSSAVYFFYHPIRIFQFTSFVFSDPLLQQTNLELYLPAECSKASDAYMELLTQRLKLYAMHQKFHAPIDDSYQAKSHSVSTLIKWHMDHPHVSRLVLSAQIIFPILAMLFMTLFFIYVIELEPRNLGKKLNNQINSSVDYISASGEAKILIVLTISVLFNICTLLTDGFALREYCKLSPEVEEYYFHDSFEFRCFYAIPYLMTSFDVLSLLFIFIPVGVVVYSYCRKYAKTMAANRAVSARQGRSGSRDKLLQEEEGAKRDDEHGSAANDKETPPTTRQSQQHSTSPEQQTTAIDIHARAHTTTANGNNISNNANTVNVNWSILLYTILSPLSCISTHAYHVIIAFIDNAYHASSVLLLFIIVLFIHVVVFQKIYYYVFKWQNTKQPSDCCTKFYWVMFILGCYLVGVLTLAVIIGLSVAMLIVLAINNAIENAPSNIYVIYQGSVAVIAALVTFQVFFRETNSVAEVFIKARDKMIHNHNTTGSENSRPRLQEVTDNDDEKWKVMSEKEKELCLAELLLKYVLHKTQDASTPTNQRDEPPDPTPLPHETLSAPSEHKTQDASTPTNQRDKPPDPTPLPHETHSAPSEHKTQDASTLTNQRDEPPDPTPLLNETLSAPSEPQDHIGSTEVYVEVHTNPASPLLSSSENC